jgi:hypothetical protein
MAAVCGSSSGLPDFWFSSTVCEPADSRQPFVSQQNGGISFPMKYIAMSEINRSAITPKCATPPPRHRPHRPPHRNRRPNAVLRYLDLIACTNLSDYAEHDINTITNIARIMVQDVSDVFRVVEVRGFAFKKQWVKARSAKNYSLNSK